jgi:hypothetical protein
MSRNINYLLVNAATGEVERLLSRPMDVQPETQSDQKLVLIEDGKFPRMPAVVDRRKVRKSITFAASASVVLKSEAPPPTEAFELERSRSKTLARMDEFFATRIGKIKGPLADLYTEKRRQAEAGGGPLVVDESDRLAILANATKEAETLAAIEAERRAVKARIRSARSIAAIEKISFMPEKGAGK